MSSLRKIGVILVISLISQIGCAVAQTTQPGGLSPQSSIDQILDALDRRGHDLHTLSAKVKLTDTDPAIGDSTVRSGKFSLENNPTGPPRVHVLFDRKEVGEHVTDEKIEYALLDGKLVDRNYARKNQATHIVLRPGEKMDFFKLGEGPFPLPLGQKRDDVHQAFDVRKIDPAKDDPAATVHAQLIPKPGTALARKFKTIDVWVNLKDEMPARITTLNLNESEIRQTDLSDVQVNPKLGDADLSLPKIDLKDWNVSEEQFDADPKDPGAGAGEKKK